MTRDGLHLKKDSTFFLSVTPNGGLSVEAQPPSSDGTYLKRPSVHLHDFRSNHVTWAVLNAFMGPRAIDPVAQLNIGACHLYFANGFDFDPLSKSPRRLLPTSDILQAQDELFGPSAEVLPDVAPDAAEPSLADAAGGARPPLAASDPTGSDVAERVETPEARGVVSALASQRLEPASVTWSHARLPYCLGTTRQGPPAAARPCATQRERGDGPVAELPLLRTVQSAVSDAHQRLHAWATDALANIWRR